MARRNSPPAPRRHASDRCCSSDGGINTDLNKTDIIIKTTETLELNTVAAATLFISSVLCDALSATDHVDGNEGPGALRITAIVLLACLAAPPIREWMVLQQRYVIECFLATVAACGNQRSGVYMRICDAIYTTVTLYTILAMFGKVYLFAWFGDIRRPRETKRKRSFHGTNCIPFVRREALANVAVATLFYSSARSLRRGLLHGFKVAAHQVNVHVNKEAQDAVAGYAYASSTTSAAISFGAAGGLATAIVLLADVEYRTRGTCAATRVLLLSACLQMGGAFVATIASGYQPLFLPALYIDTTTVASEQSRRLSVMNSTASDLWLSGLGTLTMAYGPMLHVRSRRNAHLWNANIPNSFIVGFVCVFVILRLISDLSFSGAHALTDFAVVLAVFAIAINIAFDTLLGAVLFACATACDQYVIVNTYGGANVFQYLTHVTNTCLTVLLALFVCFAFADDAANYYNYGRSTQRVTILDTFVSIFAVGGTSLAILLYCATAALQVAYDGSVLSWHNFRRGDNRYMRTVAAFTMEHWLPVLIWLPIYVRRSEIGMSTSTMRRLVWYTVPTLTVCVWGIVVTVTDRPPDQTYNWSTNPAFLFGLPTIAIIPWSVLVWA